MFINRIKEFRLRLGLSQSEVGRRAGIAEPNMSKIERGLCEAWPRARKAIAEVLDTTEGELFPEEVGGKHGR